MSISSYPSGSVHVVTLVQNVNNSILQTFKEEPKTFYLFSLSTHASLINCFQMSFLQELMSRKNQSHISMIKVKYHELTEKMHFLEIDDLKFWGKNSISALIEVLRSIFYCINFESFAFMLYLYLGMLMQKLSKMFLCNV